MILNFSIEGFISIREKQDISFCAFNKQRIKNTKYEENYILDSPFREAKSILFFGNNAVGKTNIVLALERLIFMVNEGKLLDEKWFNWNSETMSFEIVVSNKSNFFEYKLAINKKGYIESESFSKNSKNVFNFNGNLLRSKELEEKIEEIYSIKSTSPLLLKLKDFIYEDFVDFINSLNKIRVYRDKIFDEDAKWFGNMIEENYKDKVESNKNLALELLQQVDKTIVDISFELVDRVRNLYEMFLHRHSQENGKNVICSLSGESRGVKKINSLLANLLSIYDGDTIVIDELDSSISTRSLILIYNNMINSNLNKKGQLIVTTHNLELLNLDLFAPEQIYILSKTDSLATQVNSLADFDLRSNNKRLAVKFLQSDFEV